MTKRIPSTVNDPSLRKSLAMFATDTPFTIRFGLLMALLTTFVIPVVLFSPLLLAQMLGYPLAQYIGLTAKTFGVYVIGCQAIGLLLSIVIIARRLQKTGTTWSAAGLRMFRPLQAGRYIMGYYLLLLGLLFVLAIVAVGVGVNVPATPDGQPGGAEMLNLMGSFWLTFILSVILAPIIEETVFRGVLFPALAKRFGLGVGIIGSSLLFTLVHVNPIQMISTLPLGIYLAVMAHRTGSIYPGMILHASWNLLVLLIAQAAV